MKKLIVPLSLLPLLLLAACAPAAAPPSPESPAPSSVESASPRTVSPAVVDYGALEKNLPREAWETLEEYFPVLQEGESFGWTLDCGGNDSASEPLPVTWEAYFYQLWSLGDPPPEEPPLTLERLSFVDLDGDGGEELILFIPERGGWYLILHREGESFYGVDLGNRSFQGLQADGVFVGSGGAATHYYRRLRFAGGRFSEELLGYKDNEASFIGGEAVDAAKFDAWVEELMAGEAFWYAPTGELLGEKEG